MPSPNKYIECKFTRIIRTQAATFATCNIYATQEAAQSPDADGNVFYDRILLGSFKDVKFDATCYKQQIIDMIIAKMQELNVRGNHGYTLDQFICTLPDNV